MDIKSCKFCKKTFKGFSNLCPACADELDRKYIIVRNYLDRNTESNIHNVANETEVDEKSLLYLIREGRLALRGEPGGAITCMKCGVPIHSGKYCEKCKVDLVRNLETTKSAMESSIKPAQPKTASVEDNKSKMHVLKDN
jgi:uncharacterized protein